MADKAQAQPEDHDSHGSTRLYLMVFLALCVLTGASFFTYSQYWPFHDQPQIGWAFMMAVSCTKALLVILFFMHLLWEAKWKYVLTLPAMFLATFLLMMLVPDVGWRLDTTSREAWLYMAPLSENINIEPGTSPADPALLEDEEAEQAEDEAPAEQEPAEESRAEDESPAAEEPTTAEPESPQPAPMEEAVEPAAAEMKTEEAKPTDPMPDTPAESQDEEPAAEEQAASEPKTEAAPVDPESADTEASDAEPESPEAENSEPTPVPKTDAPEPPAED